MDKINLYLTTRQIERLTNESERLDITLAELIRRVLDTHIDERENIGILLRVVERLTEKPTKLITKPTKLIAKPVSGRMFRGE